VDCAEGALGCSRGSCPRSPECIDVVVPHQGCSALDVTEGDAEFGTRHAVAVGPEGLVLLGEGVEGEDEALVGMGSEARSEGTVGLLLTLSPALLRAGGALGGAASATLLGDAAEDAGEVEVAASDATATGPPAQDALRSLDVLEGVAAVSADDGVARDVRLEVVVGVQLLEEELARAIVGARSLSGLLDDVA